MSIWTRFYLPI